MKRMGFLAIALAAVVAVGCDRSHKDVAKTTTAGDPAAVGTSGANKVSSSDKDFVSDLSSRAWPRSSSAGWRPSARRIPK
jgi:hypothetical protein